jgi:hypothetical protein
MSHASKHALSDRAIADDARESWAATAP